MSISLGSIAEGRQSLIDLVSVGSMFGFDRVLGDRSPLVKQREVGIVK